MEFTTYRVPSLLKKQSVKKGDIVLKCEPFAYVVDSENSGKYCDHCLGYFEDKVLTSCPNCHAIWYCSMECARLGWKVHKCECDGLRQLQPEYPPNYCRLIVRLFFKLRNGGNEVVEKVSDKESRRFKDLMNHYRDIKDNKERMKDLSKVQEVLKIFFGDKEQVPNESEIAGIYGRMLVNRFCLLDGSMMPVGSAVYIAGSVFDHACIPNAYPSFEGKTLIVRSLEDISQFNINKMRISYVDPTKPAKWRREVLNKTWYFWCDCARCHEEDYKWMETTLICDNPDCCGPVHVPDKLPANTQLQCDECGSIMENKTVDKYQDIIGFTVFRFGKLREDNLVFEDCCELVDRQEKVFFSLNAWRVRSLNYAFNAALYKGVWSLAYSYGTRNLDGMRYYHGNNHPALGMFLLKLGKASLNLRCFQEGMKYLEESEEILTIALGKEHKLVSEEIPQLKLLANEDLSILMARRVQALREKEERERREQEELNLFNKLIMNHQKRQDVQPIWERDRKVFEQEKEWKVHLEL